MDRTEELARLREKQRSLITTAEELARDLASARAGTIRYPQLERPARVRTTEEIITPPQ